MLDDGIDGGEEPENAGTELSIDRLSSWRQALTVDLQRPKIPPITIPQNLLLDSSQPDGTSLAPMNAIRN